MVKLRTTSFYGNSIIVAILLLINEFNLINAQNQNPRRDRHRDYPRSKNLNFQKPTVYFSLTTPPSPSLPLLLRGDQMPPILDDEYNDDYDFIEIQSNSNNRIMVPPANKQLNSQTTNTDATTHKTPSYIATRTTTTPTINKLRSPIYVSYHHKEIATRVHPCEHSSCYPATGNLLIGRENRLYASSTCGLNGAERFCIVSHLEEKKCFLCDTRSDNLHDPHKNHRIGQIIYSTKQGTRSPSWWQSENGKANVTIQLDLEAEFHFTHLIIVFSTFRPAAMFIERSYDTGKTWHIYRYFAHNCAESFPGIPTTSKNITDVVCDNRYSSVEPSKHGEVIFRVLPPNMKVENPYAEHVQNMLKMTNLRINFTKLHNLGDTLLDDREEIQEKYYYGISNMVVRGSCSCYGHASRCLPLEGANANEFDMVHGRCECTHNTRGLNCEECEDFFNDLPWNPALGKQTNACKKCNCNNHATSCHFVRAVYEHSGRVSGGVCDNCQHNTQGQHCEACLPFFYRDPFEDIQSPHVCQPCDCDPNGSLDEGICDSVSDPENGIESGACHCKPNVKGRRCDACKDGFWNLDPLSPLGCQNCTCNTLGTVDNSGCNMFTGECTCKRLVTGKDCNQCEPKTYGLSDGPDGCTLCDCDPGGALDNYCDVFTGQCRCRPHITGRTCNVPYQLHFVPSLHITYEAEAPEITECITYSSYGNCSVIPYQTPVDRQPGWTGQGYERVPEKSELDITVSGVPRTMTYDVVIRYLTQTRGDWEDAYITIIRPDEYDPNGNCSNAHPSYEQAVPFTLPEHETYVVAMHDICLEQGKTYKFKIKFDRHRHDEDNPAAQILIDSLSLIPRIEVTPIFRGDPPANNRQREYTQLGCNRTYYDIHYEDSIRNQPKCKELLNTVSILVFGGGEPCECNPTGSISKQCQEDGGNCQCKPNVNGRQCDLCAPGTYGFGPQGCTACDCNSIGSKDNDCDLKTGQCNCHPNTYGRECDQCQPGFWNFPNCQMCQCNGHAQTCDSRTGQCLFCMEYTTGYNCDRCLEGYYGNPLLGSEIGCRPCRCPDTIQSGHTHANHCELDRRNNDMICYCTEGYGGPRCDDCADNYFGNPEKPGGTCSQCNCNNNIDLYKSGNCDSKTGKCLQCLYDTTGDNCEYCRDGFYGDAMIQNCRQCDCDMLGTNSTILHCDRNTGQCPCLNNVEGLRCDECAANHWKIASGIGCEPCDCDPIGAELEQCNTYEGQCSCRQGFGGRKCDQCQANYWGNPNVQCHECNCDRHGSANAQCNRENGECVCHNGIGGYKCDKCARGYLGESPYCTPCGECFDNWNDILSSLEAETKDTIEQAKQIKTVGATGAYTAHFNAMDDKLKIIQQLLDNTTVSFTDIEELQTRVQKLRNNFNESFELLESTEDKLGKVYSNVSLSTVLLENLRNQSDHIKALSHQLKENATELQEANIEGALNLTRDALQRVNALSAVHLDAELNSDTAEQQCKRTEIMVNRAKSDFEDSLKHNNDVIDDFQIQLNTLNQAIPDLNNNICDKSGDPCDSLCGGAGCGTCGGLSCDRGALTRAEKALKLSKDAENEIKKKKDAADTIIRSLSQAKNNASDAYMKASEAFEDAERHLNKTHELISSGDKIVQQLNDIINNKTASPEEIKELAEKTLNLDLQLGPEEINKLGKQINDAVASLEDVETIIRNTRYDLSRVDSLKQNVNDTNTKAQYILNSATSVVNALDEADAAQAKAETAIKQANSDIGLAEEDLNKIDLETSGAKRPAEETSERVSNLAKKLNRLQKDVLKNEIDGKDINAQALEVKNSASKAHEQASQLKNKFKSANDSLTTKANTSEKARERAQQLLQRASKITVDTNEKLKELEGMSNVYKSKEQKLDSLKDKLTVLNEQMSNYLHQISYQAGYYRECIS